MDPFFGRNPVVRDLQVQRSRIEQVRENTSRQAWCWGHFTSTGSGEIVVPDALPFGITYVHPPAVAHGFYVDGETLVAGRFPRVTAGVSRWVTTPSGFYIGAWVFMAIDSSGPDAYLPASASLAMGSDALPAYVIDHSFSFSGVAIKDLPVWNSPTGIQL